MTQDPPAPGPISPAETPPSLGRTATAAVGWQSLSYIGGKALTLITAIILARLLTPNDFGLVAIALVFITYAEVITDFGISQALIYLPDERARRNAGVVVAAVWAVVLVGVAQAAAPTVAGFFGRPEITPMFRVLSLSLLIGAVGGVPDALLRKHLRLRRRLVAIIARVAVKGVVSISLALAGAGPWSLVYGYIAGEATWAILSWILAGHRPSLAFWRVRRDDVRGLLGFGLPAAGNALVLSVVFNIDYLIVGQQLGSRPLGFYTIAYRVPELLILQALWVVSVVAFPLFSMVRDDPERLKRGYLTGLRVQSVYGAATGTGLAVVAPMLVPVLFGAQWAESVRPLQGIAIYAMFVAVGKGALDLFRGLGRPGLAVTLSLLRLAAVVPALLIATGYGIEAVAWAHAAVALLVAVLHQGVAARLLRMRAREMLAAMIPAAAVAMGTLLGAGAVRLWLPGPDVARLAAALVGGGAAGLGALWIADPRFVPRLIRMVRRPRADRAAAPPVS